ncbi:MAG TPA: CxxH/CxxC protein [Sedimentibacter sp.]|nr:CxxH/CxxC protein [Sedimentibacter sp.]
MEENIEKIIYTCFEHVEQALDDFVNFQEIAPQIIKTNSEQKCNYCHKNSEYKIMK